MDTSGIEGTLRRLFAGSRVGTPLSPRSAACVDDGIYMVSSGSDIRRAGSLVSLLRPGAMALLKQYHSELGLCIVCKSPTRQERLLSPRNSTASDRACGSSRFSRLGGITGGTRFLLSVPG